MLLATRSFCGIKRDVLWFAFKDSVSTPELQAWWAEMALMTSSLSWWPSSRWVRSMCAQRDQPPVGADSRVAIALPSPRMYPGSPVLQVGLDQACFSKASVRTKDVWIVSVCAQHLRSKYKGLQVPHHSHQLSRWVPRAIRREHLLPKDQVCRLKTSWVGFFCVFFCLFVLFFRKACFCLVRFLQFFFHSYKCPENTWIFS